MDEDPGDNVNIGIKFDGATYLLNHTADFQWSQCVDMFDVEPRGLGETIPGWETIFEDLGGYWKLDMPSEGRPQLATLKSCLLKQRTRGASG